MKLEQPKSWAEGASGMAYVEFDIDHNLSDCFDSVESRIKDLEEASSSADPAEVARHMDVDAVASSIEVDMYDLAQNIDDSEIARCIDVSDVAYNISTSDVADHVDEQAVASYIDADDIASHISLSGVAAEISASEVAEHMAYNIDMDTVADHILSEKLNKQLGEAIASALPTVMSSMWVRQQELIEENRAMREVIISLKADSATLAAVSSVAAELQSKFVKESGGGE